jgi:hypothetical protein
MSEKTSVVDYEKINKIFKEIDEFLQSEFYQKLKKKYEIEMKLEEERRRFEEERRKVFGRIGRKGFTPSGSVLDTEIAKGYGEEKREELGKY